MGEMTLEQVREWLVGKERMYVGYQRWATSLNEQEVRAFRAAIDGRLATPAQTVDVEAVREVSAQLKFSYGLGLSNGSCQELANKLSQAIGDKT